jgi:cytochrome b pre-mRNA-processing protein 3
MMLRWLKARAEVKRKAGEIYGAIVTQARHPLFYADLGIPDTPAGRYEAVVLHLFLVLERLRQAGAEASDLSRGLIEAFVADMDDSARQLGASDTGAPRKVRRATAGFYERSADYRAAMGDTRRLEAALAKHALAGDTGSRQSGALLCYVQRAAQLLSREGLAAPLQWTPAFPAPGAKLEDLP